MSCDKREYFDGNEVYRSQFEAWAKSHNAPEIALGNSTVAKAVINRDPGDETDTFAVRKQLTPDPELRICHPELSIYWPDPDLGTSRK